MARHRSRRQRLKRDPSNQPWHKVVAWCRKRPEHVDSICTPQSLCRIMPRIQWRRNWGDRFGRYWRRLEGG